MVRGWRSTEGDATFSLQRMEEHITPWHPSPCARVCIVESTRSREAVGVSVCGVAGTVMFKSHKPSQVY